MYTKIDSCLACGNKELIPVLDLGDQPLANTYTKKRQELTKFPLNINRCSHCFHVQLSVSVDPDLMFKEYLYVSGTSKTMTEYFKWFARYTVEYSKMLFKNDNLHVLDIGCNDGTQLDIYKNELNCQTQGIDPAENLFPISSQKHNIICDYFDDRTLAMLIEPDIIVAQNVFAHNYNPLEFMQNVKTLMHDKSLFFIQTSQANMILNNEFDTIYHEHISFYNIKSMNELCKRSGLNLIDVIKSPLHGTSYIFVISKDLERKSNIDNLIAMEEVAGLYKSSTYENYRTQTENNKLRLKETIDILLAQGYKFIGYGAAAKGNTFLNYMNLDTNPYYIIDDNPLKHNLYTPGTQVQITSIDVLDTFGSNEKILFLPLAWNFFNEIRGKIKSKRNNENDLFLMYFPKVIINK